MDTLTVGDIAQAFLERMVPGERIRAIPFHPDPWQRDVLQSDARRQILCCARQVGKSTVVGADAYTRAKYEPNSLVLMVAPAFRQSLNLFRKVKEAIRIDPEPIQAIKETQTEMELANGSRVIALPGKDETIRSFGGVTELIIDEAAYVPDQIFHAVRPFVATSGGRIVLLSTPGPKQGFFWRMWNSEGWEKYRVAAYDCPRIPGDEVDDARSSMPEWAWEREYLAEFTDPEDALLSEVDIQAMLDAHVAPLLAPTFVDESIPALGVCGG